MTCDETKRDLHHLYRHWRHRITSRDARMNALLFYAWLKSTDNGILGYGNFGPGAVYPHIAGWIEEWERAPAAQRVAGPASVSVSP